MKTKPMHLLFISLLSLSIFGCSLYGQLTNIADPNSANYVGTPAGLGPNGTTANTKPTLTWQQLSAASEYRIEIADDASFNSDVTNTKTSKAQYAVTTALSNGFTYYWRVAAISSSGQRGLWSTTASFTVTSFSISGTVALSGNGLSGVTVSAGTVSTTTDSAGNYTLSLSGAGTYTVTPSKSGYSFTPSSATETLTSTSPSATNVNFTGNPSSYSISGTVSLSGASGFPGVTVTAGSTSTTTDSAGNYTLTLSGAGTYTVTPSKSGYTFTPVAAPETLTSTSPSATNVNFTGNPSSYSISGTVTLSGGAGLSGVTVSAGGTSTTTDSAGNYTLTLSGAGTYTVTPSKSGYSFTPSSSTETLTSTGSTQTAVNFIAVVSTFAIVLSPETGGTISISPNQSSYTYGQSITVTASPNNGFSFGAWGGDLSGSTNPYSLTVTKNLTISATFVQRTYTISLSPGSGGTISLSPSQPVYSYGQVVTATANPSNGYIFSSWGGDLSGSTNPTSFAVTRNMSVAALFAAGPQISLQKTSLTFDGVTGGGNQSSPSAQTVLIENSGNGSLDGLSVSGMPSWLTASLNSTTAPATLTVQASNGSLLPGTQTATLSVKSSKAGNSPQNISVTFNLVDGTPKVVLETPGSEEYSATGYSFEWRVSDQDGDPLIFKLYIANNTNNPYANPMAGYPIAINSSNGAYFYQSGYSNFSVTGHVLSPTVQLSAGTTATPDVYTWGVAVSDDGGRTWYEALINGTTNTMTFEVGH